jgi:hypothetical protein
MGNWDVTADADPLSVHRKDFKRCVDFAVTADADSRRHFL